VRVVEQGQRLLEVTGHGPRDHRGVPLADEEAEGAAGTQDLADGGQGCRGVVDDLEDAVAQHHVCAGGAGDLEQVGHVPLLAGDGHPLLPRAAVEGGQGVGAGVDDRDPVAELGDPDREPAGAAADVEHVERVPVQDRRQGLPHDGGPGGAPAARWAAPAAHWLTCVTP
jgi:hypothetical protein